MEGKRIIRRMTVVFLVITLVFLSLITINLIRRTPTNMEVAKAADWYNYDWAYRSAITIDNTKVNADLTDFPVLISSTQADWADTGHGGYAEQADGGDFVFTNSAGTVKLAHEIAKYDNTTGQLVAWVKTDLANSSDTIIYLYYGHDDVADQWNVASTWSGYHDVYHLDEPSGTAVDETATADMTLTSATQNVDSKISKGVQFDGVNGTGSFTEQNLGTTHSVSIWANMDSGANGNFFSDNAKTSLWQTYQTGGTWGLWYQQTAGNYVTLSGAIAAFTPGTWYYLTFTRSGSTVKFYINGVQSGTDRTLSDGAGSFYVNGMSNWTKFKGILDEGRTATSVLSAEWISTEYNNQNSPGTFYSIGANESGDTSAPSNPTAFSGYDVAAKTHTLTSGNWAPYSAPYFEFSGAADNESGVKGYYIYFGTNSSADPYTDGSYQAHSGIASATQTYTSAALTEGQTFYFILKTENNALLRSDAVTKFTYSYDATAPSPPEYINVSPVGCSSGSTFTFTWPAASDTGGSNIATYQYRKGTTGTVNDIATTSLATTAYQEGDNIMYIRSIDGAGNSSSWQTSVFCSTATVQVVDGPTVTAGPSSITVSWTSSKATTGYVKVYDGNTYISEQGLTNYSLSHTVRVIGLEPEKQYRYQITWTDQSGNLGETEWFSTNTAVAPQINNLKSEILSPTSINVSWSSTIAARYRLEYGIGNYGTFQDINDLQTGYSTRINNLQAGATYQLRVNATGEDGTKFFSGESFVLPPLPAIGSLKFEAIKDRPTPALKVSWTTNTETTSSIFYNTQGETAKEISKTDRVKDHEIEISQLSDNSEYEIYASGIDSFGNLAKSSVQTFKTEYDTRPPEIKAISTESSNIGMGKENSAKITVGYSTDEPAKCLLEYGEGISGTSYSGKTVSETILSTNHLSLINNLQPQTPYHFKVICMDKANNKTESLDQTVISGDITQSVFNIIIKTLDSLFGWLGDIM
jgi:hypothetical protein